MFKRTVTMMLAAGTLVLAVAHPMVVQSRQRRTTATSAASPSTCVVR
jgi:hypothetical protein